MSAQTQDRWLALMESGAGHMDVHCLHLLIDQAGCDQPVLAGIRALEPVLPCHVLFEGMPESGIADMGPLLVKVDLSQPLHRHWLEGLIQRYGADSRLLVVVSKWPFDRLGEHLGQCLEATYNGCGGVLRYYDPRVFAQLFSHVLQPAQQDRFLRPALFWSWLDRDCAPQRLLGLGAVPEGSADVRPLDLDASQLARLGCTPDATRAMSRLNGLLPAQWTTEQRFQACYAALIDASDAGLLAEEPREAFVRERLLAAETGKTS